MNSTTQRRSSVALLVLTAFVLSIDTANAVRRQAPQPTPVVHAVVHPTSVEHARLVSVPVRRAAVPKAHRRAHLRAAAPAKRRAHVTPRRIIRTKHLHRIVKVTGPTGWAALDAAISRIPTYRPGASIWLVSNRYGHWGTADWYHDTLYVAPNVPTTYLYDVAVHEWSHELSVLDYNGDVEAAVAAMNAVFGGTGLVGAERAADCMARLQGASWTHYTSCLNRDWRIAAAKLVAGQRL
jgi:hypothetical protein